MGNNFFEKERINDEEAMLKQEIKGFLNRPVKADNNDDVLCFLKKEIKTAISEKEAKVRKEQYERRSSILIASHPVNSDFKFLAVLNDIPEKHAGAIAMDDMERWFLSLKSEIFSNLNLLYAEYVNKLMDFGKTFVGIETGSFPTFSGVIVGPYSSLIVSIGDTTIYTYRNGKIKPFTTEYDKVFSIVNGLKMRSNIIENDKYASLVLISNGEYESLSNDRVKIIARNTKREDLAQSLLVSS